MFYSALFRSASLHSLVFGLLLLDSTPHSTGQIAVMRLKLFRYLMLKVVPISAIHHASSSNLKPYRTLLLASLKW